VKFIGGRDLSEVAHNAVAADAHGDYPLVVRGDSILLRLLFLRDRWGVSVTDTALSQLENDSGSGPDTDASTDAEWLREWRHTWQCLDIAHAAWRQHRTQDIPDTLHPAWFAVDDVAGTPGYSSFAYRAWLGAQPGSTASSGHIDDPVTRNVAFAAADRGLTALFILPITGLWSGRTRHLLAASVETFSSVPALRSALSAFA
jgi:hypothetical protein